MWLPLFFLQQLFPANYVGMTYKEAFYDLDKWLAANEKAIKDFDPDVYFFLEAGVMSPGRTYEILGHTQTKWPGGGVDENTSFQFVEKEYMKADEYDLFLDDPSDFLLRYYLPRTNKALEGLQMLAPLKGLIMGPSMFAAQLNIPPVAAAFSALSEAGLEMARWTVGYQEFYKSMASKGYPLFSAGISLAPFDLISDFLRGMRGIMLDMYRCPDKLIAAQEKVLPLLIGMAAGAAHLSGNPRIFIPLHRGADGFMSLEQFETFYWPFLKSLINALVDLGLTPCPFFEGVYDQRMHYLRELPQGKVFCFFDRSDLFKAKDVIGDVVCIGGGMPLSMLIAGSPEEIRELTRKHIEIVGKDGGFVMSASTSMDDAKPELVRAWVDAVHEFGVY